MKARTCFTTRDEFVSRYAGIVNAEIKYIRTSVRFETKYTLVAQRIALDAKNLGMNVLHTTTDDGLHVVTVKSFGSKTWRIS